jgi:hypothetical protein
MRITMWLEDNLLGKITSPIAGAFVLIPDTLLSIAGKIALAVILAGITFLTNKLLEVWWNKRKRKK